jgi:hypothetical protein
MSRSPSQLKFGLCIATSSNLRHHQNEMLTGDNAPKPGRHMPRRLGPDELRQDLARARRRRRCRWLPAVHTPQRGPLRRRILDVDERPPTRVAADHWGMSLGDLVDEQAIEETRIDAVERAITQDHSLKVGPSRHKVFEIPDSVERATKLSRWMWIECLPFQFYRRSLAGVGPATIAVHDDALDCCFTRGGEQMVKACGTKAVAARKHLIEVTQIYGAAEVHHLVNDHVGLDGPHNFTHLGSVESIDNGGLTVELADRVDFRRAPRGTNDPMAGRDRPWHEMSTKAPVAPAMRIRMSSTPLWVDRFSPLSRLRRTVGLAANDEKRDHGRHQHPTNVTSAVGNGVADRSVTIDEDRYGHDPMSRHL